MGLPDFRRKGVRGYRISQVLLAPGGAALVVTDGKLAERLHSQNVSAANKANAMSGVIPRKRTTPGT